MINKVDNTAEEQKTTEDRILEAAETEFMQKGFTSARTTAIAEAAGVTHAMLHYYYRTKDRLFAKIIDNKLSELARTFIIDIDNKSSLSDCVRKAVLNHFDFVRSNPLLPRFLICEVFSNEKLMKMLKDKLGTLAASTIAQLQSKIDKGVADGECEPIEAVTLVLDIVSLNVFPILAAPMVCKVMNMNTSSEFNEFLDSRKEENVRVILSRLRI